MGPKKKLSAEEIKAKKSVAAKKRRERIKNDPVLAAIEAEKERKKYERKKLKKQVKLVKDMTPREHRAAQKSWRQRAKASYERRKQTKELINHLANDSPPPSDSESQALLQARRNSGRKKIKLNRTRVARENMKLKEENAALRRKADKWRQRHYRLQKRLVDKDSPRKVIDKLVASGKKSDIKRKLLFAEAVNRQLRYNYQKLSSKKDKKSFGKHIVGDGKFLRRYNLVSKISNTISRSIFKKNYITNNTLLRQRMKKINYKVQQDVCAFLEDDEVSKLCPGKKDCLTRKKIKKQKRVLSDTLINLHSRFLKVVDYKISYTSFCKLKPFWVVRHKVSERDTCMCKIHTNIKYLMNALYKASIIDSSNATEFAMHICCDKHNVSCLQRTCNNCKQLQIPYLMHSQESSVTYFKWVTKTERYTDKNNKIKITKKVVKEKFSISALKAVDLFETEFIKFLFHEGNALHQVRAIKFLKSQLAEDEILIHCDFSENYSMKYASEIQSFHFGGSRQQFSLHTSQIYFKKDSFSNLISQSMCTLSENLDHGPAAVWGHLQPVLQFIKETVPRVKKVHFLSDSPSAQYRNRTIFYLLSHALRESLDNIEVATWNYQESGHGKGAPDGVGGCLKRTADRIVAQGQDVDSFNRFVEVLKENIRNVKITVVEDKDIQSMKTVIPANIPAFKGTMKVHQVVYLISYPKTVTMRSLSCFRCFDCNRFFLGQLKFPQEEIKPDSACTEVPEVECELLPETMLDSQSQQLHCSPATYILVRFENICKKTASTSTTNDFHYVCCIEKVNEDDTYNVIGLRSLKKSLTQFVVKDNDIFTVTTQDIIKVLPDPHLTIMGRKIVYSFPFAIDVKEQQ